MFGVWEHLNIISINIIFMFGVWEFMFGVVVGVHTIA